MKVIKLKENEIKFLRNECGGDILLNYLSSGYCDEKSSSLILILNTKDIETIADELLSILNDKGLDEEGEVNLFGKAVDNLIDKFNQYY